MSKKRSSDTLIKLFESKSVVDIQTIRTALNDASLKTAFRYLKKIDYRSSYNHNGRYYTLHIPSRYDRFGLWSHGDIHFSLDGNLTNTARRLVYEAEGGATQQELFERLKVRVHNTLLELLRKKKIDREKMVNVFVYLNSNPVKRTDQLQRRRELLDSQKNFIKQGKINDQVIIQVLLTLIRHPGAKPRDVVRRLERHSPPITLTQVNSIFLRYDLDKIGKKRGNKAIGIVSVSRLAKRMVSI